MKPKLLNRMDRIAALYDEDGTEPEGGDGFEPCRSCPWPGACASRQGCEADD